MNQTLTAIDGIEVGHWTQQEARTGCTVVLCPEEGCLASGFVLGNAPGSRETALLAPEKTVERVHAVVLSGGSAFGLDAASGVMRYLEEQGRGFQTSLARIPIVPAAVIYDLAVGRADIRPTAEAGYKAASSATRAPVQLGRIGVGTGATVSKLSGSPIPGGLGGALIEIGEAKIAALAVSNALGDIVDPASAALVGKTRTETRDLLASFGTNTTLVLVATNVPLSKAQAYQLSQTAHIGIARVTRPSHTVFDGDTSFVLSTGTGPVVPPMALSIAVQEVVAEALLMGVRLANQ